MIDTIVEMFSYPFMVRAFAVGSLVALCAALLGVSLVLKQYSASSYKAGSRIYTS